MQQSRKSCSTRRDHDFTTRYPSTVQTFRHGRWDRELVEGSTQTSRQHANQHFLAAGLWRKRTRHAKKKHSCSAGALELTGHVARALFEPRRPRNSEDARLHRRVLTTYTYRRETFLAVNSFHCSPLLSRAVGDEVIPSAERRTGRRLNYQPTDRSGHFSYLKIE